MKSRVHVIVSGSVQGVFFRSEIENLAIENGVTGWVKNLPDGRVEAIFEGEEQSILKLVEFCKRGPPLAKVEKVSISKEAFREEYTDFRVKY